jgi:hypothetical protein
MDLSSYRIIGSEDAFDAHFVAAQQKFPGDDAAVRAQLIKDGVIELVKPPEGAASVLKEEDLIARETFAQEVMKREKLVVSTPDINDLPADQQARAREILAQVKGERQAKPESPKPEAKPSFSASLPELPPVPGPVKDESPKIQAHDDVHCVCCGNIVTGSYKLPEPTETDKRNWVRCLVTRKCFTKQLSVYEGAVKMTFRTLTAAEQRAAVSAGMAHVRKMDINPGNRVLWAAAQMQRQAGIELMFALTEVASDEGSGITPLAPARTIEEDDDAINKRFVAWHDAFDSVQIELFAQEHRTFCILVNQLRSMARRPDFFAKTPQQV